jgi:hypothetical protein
MLDIKELLQLAKRDNEVLGVYSASWVESRSLYNLEEDKDPVTLALKWRSPLRKCLTSAVICFVCAFLVIVVDQSIGAKSEKLYGAVLGDIFMVFALSFSVLTVISLIVFKSKPVETMDFIEAINLLERCPSLSDKNGSIDNFPISEDWLNWAYLHKMSMRLLVIYNVDIRQAQAKKAALNWRVAEMDEVITNTKKRFERSHYLLRRLLQCRLEKVGLDIPKDHKFFYAADPKNF